MKTSLLTLFISVLSTQAFAEVEIKELRVYKNERKIELITKEEQVYKTYKIMLGRNPEGHKTKDGDNKTPEGTYTLDIKNPTSKFHKAFHISYPNTLDILKARMHGKNPGGNIMLHGMPNNFSEMQDWLTSVKLDSLSDETLRSSLLNYDWTNGCIAVTDAEIDEIYSIVDVPTKIVINP
jgi:murein L,D-transpeptidase YafK